MKILVIGLGVIGSTYGYLFQKAGHRVEHLIRDSKKAQRRTDWKSSCWTADLTIEAKRKRIPIRSISRATVILMILSWLVFRRASWETP